jgi:hypothetical protein
VATGAALSEGNESSAEIVARVQTPSTVAVRAARQGALAVGPPLAADTSAVLVARAAVESEMRQEAADSEIANDPLRDATTAAAAEIAGTALTTLTHLMTGTATHATGVVPVTTAPIRRAEGVTTATTDEGRSPVAVMSVTTVTTAAAKGRGATGADIAATETAVTAQPAVDQGLGTETTTPPPLSNAGAAAAVAGRAAVEAPGSMNTATASRHAVEVPRVATAVATRMCMTIATMPGPGAARRLETAAVPTDTAAVDRRLPATRMSLDPPRPRRRGALDRGPPSTTMAAVVVTAGGRLAARPVRAAPAAAGERAMMAADAMAIAATDTAATETAASMTCLLY